MPNERKIKSKVTFRPSADARRIIESELAARPDLSPTEIINLHMLMASKPDFRRAYRAALADTIRRLQEDLRKLDESSM